MIKILLGGSPCTYWSIAQKNNRETQPSGIGWELFENYLIAKEKFKPDIFLYENNKSAAQAIKDEIKKRLNVWDGSFLTEDSGARYIEINSALVSAQNRQRFYVHNCGNVEQPKDRGIMLRDILESGVVDREKAYCLKHQQGNARDYFKKKHTQIAFEHIEYPIRIGTIENDAKKTGHDSKQYRVYSPDGKSTTLCGQGGGVGAKTGLYAIPVNTTNGKAQTIKAQYSKTSVANICCYSSTYGASGVAIQTKQNDKQKVNIYEVKDGQITIKGKQYPIKLKDGYYIIRKLTVTECCRLQTLPDDYCRAVSASQGYKGCGNGWTAEVIIHILSHALKNVPKDEKIVVLSMYDGIGTGRYCLDKMGFTNVEYHSYEKDRYAIMIAMSNYPDIIQHGDAFQVRDEKWSLGK